MILSFLKSKLVFLGMTALLTPCMACEDSDEDDSSEVDGGGGAGGGETGIYTMAADTDEIIALKDAESEVEIVGNQIVLTMSSASTRSDAKKVASKIKGQIVGQIPELHIYQIELSGTVSLAGLDKAIDLAEAESNVVSAGYNPVVQFEAAACPPDTKSDLQDILKKNGLDCQARALLYEDSLYVFEALRSQLTLSQVKVGVIDSGLQAGNGQFDDLSVTGYKMDSTKKQIVAIAKKDLKDHLVGHGSEVVSVIAADNDNNLTSGIASRFLKDKLDLHVVQAMIRGEKKAVGDHLQAVALTTHLIKKGVRLVNLSFGYVRSGGAGKTTPQISNRLKAEFQKISGVWKSLLTYAKNTLFIAAISNNPLVTAQRDVPAGISADNLISVGGTDVHPSTGTDCTPVRVWQSTATFGSPKWGDVYAPASSVAVVDMDGKFLKKTGNSFAAPQVTSVAAILLSINPKLTPKQLKDYLVAFRHKPDSLKRVEIAMPMMQVILASGPSAQVNKTLDGNGLKNGEPIYSVRNRICGSLSWQVDGFQSQAWSGYDVLALGDINSSSLSFWGPFLPAAQSLGKQFITLSVSTTTLKPGSTFSFGSGVAAAQFSAKLMTSPFPSGDAISGSLTISACRVDGRDVVTNAPQGVKITGSFDGVMKIYMTKADFDKDKPTMKKFSGKFDLRLRAPTNTSYLPELAAGPMRQSVEQNCTGGLPSAP